MIAMAAVAAMTASAANASIIRFDWIGGPQTLSGEVLSYPENDGYLLTREPYSAAFVFQTDESITNEFDYAASFFADHDAPTLNPFNVTLLSRPDGHLGGYFDGEYALSFSSGIARVFANLKDYDDVLMISSSSIYDDHNQGFFAYGSSGFWSASVDGSAVASSQIISTVPIPASGVFLLAALGGLYVRKRKGRG
jgi:hypothetical protein